MFHPHWNTPQLLGVHSIDWQKIDIYDRGIYPVSLPSRADNNQALTLIINSTFSFDPIILFSSAAHETECAYLLSLISLSIEGTDWTYTVVLAGRLLLLFFFGLGVEIIDCFRNDCSFRRVGQSTFSILFLFGSLLVCYSQWVATAFTR